MACDAEDSGFQMLNDDEIVTFMQEEPATVDDETDEYEDNNKNESSKGPTNADLFSALETFMEWHPLTLDLYALDFFFWDHLKSLVFETLMATVEDNDCTNSRHFS
ncbi:uncharacterized protein TNCV_387111 [Trichonephila clavipes]|nr:uncharacterized protein TNCV_387111 [Trichonephila clavipes]